MTRRLVRWIWKLYPPRLRRRFETELEKDLEACSDPQAHASRKAKSGAWLLTDALTTLVRAWAVAARRLVGSLALATELRLALRSLYRAPGYSLVVVAILALALGANTAVFSVTHAVLLRGLPYGAADRAVGVSHGVGMRSAEWGWQVDASFLELPQIEAAALYIDGGGANLTRGGEATRVSLAQVTEDFFRVLGVDTLVGPGLMAAGDGNRTAVLSHALWAQAFGADPDVVGRTIELNGNAHTITGVMPVGVAFPSPVDLWIPFPPDGDFYSIAYRYSSIALLAPGVEHDALRAVLADRARAESAANDRLQAPPRTTRLRDELTGSVRTPLLVLLSLSGLVVLLGCLNLAGLVLSRTAARSNELAVRRALGAGRLRLFGQLLIEVGVLAALGGIASIGAATVAAGLLRRMLPGGTPGLDDAAISAPVLGFAAVLTAVAGLLVGAGPALQGALVRGRARGGPAHTQGRGGRRLHGFLVVGQVALAAVLVVGATLLGRSLYNLQSVPLGYDLERVLTFQVRLPQAAFADPTTRRAYLRDLMAGLRGALGVIAVGATNYLPQQEAAAVFVGVRPAGAGEGADDYAHWVQADRGYFAAMGIPVIEGDVFAERGAHDRGYDRIAINESLARTLFPDGGLYAGREASILYTRSGDVATRIEAVVGDVYLRGWRGDPMPIIYTDIDVAPSSDFGVAVRTQGDAALLAERAREIAAAIDPRVAPYDVSTTGQTAARQIAVEAAIARLSLVFSVSALALAALGLYGLVSQALVRRRRELGIRLALGALPGGLVRAAMLRPLALTVVGLGMGLAAALAAGRLLSSLLFDVAPGDPVILAAVAAAVVGVAALAAWLSARAALQVDPVESMRSE